MSKTYWGQQGDFEKNISKTHKKKLKLHVWSEDSDMKPGSWKMGSEWPWMKRQDNNKKGGLWLLKTPEGLEGSDLGAGATKT